MSARPPNVRTRDASLPALCLALGVPVWLTGGRDAGAIWEAGNAPGFAALALLLYLCFAGGRGAGYERHRALGWCAVVLTLGHAAWFLVLDANVREYLEPAAPLYMWAGVIGFVLLVGLVTSSGRRLRRVAFERHFRNEHWWLAALVLAAVAWHVAATGYYYTGLTTAWPVLLCVAIAAVPRLRLPRAGPSGTTGRAIIDAVAALAIIGVLLAAPYLPG
jgi:DMSO/TMAO reductase YedYZ heme-binding membrane subunit